jgi:hypothetical protein
MWDTDRQTINATKLSKKRRNQLAGLGHYEIALNFCLSGLYQVHSVRRRTRLARHVGLLKLAKEPYYSQ